MFLNQIFKSTPKRDRGASLIECALLMPVLIFLVSGVVTIGDLISQQPWTAQSAYQLAEILATTPNDGDIGVVAMQTRLRQIREERDNRFKRFDLTVVPSFGIGSSYYSQINGTDVVSVRFDAEITTAWRAYKTPLTMQITAPYLARKISVNGLTPYEDPPAGQRFGCCGEAIGNGGNPSSCWANTTGTPACSVPDNPLIWP